MYAQAPGANVGMPGLCHNKQSSPPVTPYAAAPVNAMNTAMHPGVYTHAQVAPMKPENSYNPYDQAPVSPPPQRERFSYTRYQLELLTAIIGKIRYPNTMQKQLIAKRVGITRDQVKIWFQNRRRKDVVAAQNKKDSDSPKSEAEFQPKMVPQDVLDSVISEMLAYNDDVYKTNKSARAKIASERTKPYSRGKARGGAKAENHCDQYPISLVTKNKGSSSSSAANMGFPGAHMNSTSPPIYNPYTMNGLCHNPAAQMEKNFGGLQYYDYSAASFPGAVTSVDTQISTTPPMTSAGSSYTPPPPPASLISSGAMPGDFLWNTYEQVAGAHINSSPESISSSSGESRSISFHSNTENSPTFEPKTEIITVDDQETQHVNPMTSYHLSKSFRPEFSAPQPSADQGYTHSTSPPIYNYSVGSNKISVY